MELPELGVVKRVEAHTVSAPLVVASNPILSPARMTLGRGSALTIPLLAPVVLSSCGPGGPPPPPPTTTGVNAIATQNAGGAASCSGSLVWKYDMVQAEPGTGHDTDFAQSRTYDEPAENGRCVYSDGELGLRPGYWTVAVANITCNSVHLTPVVGNHTLTMNDCAIDFGALRPIQRN